MQGGDGELHGDRSRVDSNVHQGIANIGSGNVHVDRISYNSEYDISEACIHVHSEPTDYGGSARPPDLADTLYFEGMNFRQASVRSADASTCQWLLDSPEYRRWWSDDHSKDHCRLFWIKGAAGAGKSTLMKYAVDQSPKSAQKVLISHFFDAQGISELEKTTEGMYRTLLYCILDYVPEKEVKDLTPKRLPIRNGHWPLESLVKLMKLALPKMTVQRLTIFIDALDECDEKQVRDMVRLIEELIITNSSLWVCFASRPYPFVSSIRESNFDISLQAKHMSSIAGYIKSHINIGDSKVAMAVKKKLIQKPGAVFMWAYLVVDILN